MRTGVLVAGAMLTGAVVLWLSRGSGPRESAHGESEAAPAATQQSLAPVVAPPPSARESNATDPEPLLRGRVVTDTGEPLPGAALTLSFLDETLAETESDADGRFTLPAPPREGVELAGRGPDDRELTPASLELDRAPAEELVFVARRVVVQRGPVRGVVVDALTARPVPYLAGVVGGEPIETDPSGRFVSTGEHPPGLLVLDFFASPWSYVVGDFDPGSPDELVVPVRIGPALFLELGPIPENLAVSWLPGGVNADVWNIRSLSLREEAPCLVRLPALQRGERVQGDLVFYAYPECVGARVPIQEGGGTTSRPIPVELQPCGFVEWSLRLSREPDWYEKPPWVSLRSEGAPAGLPCESSGIGGFSAVLHSGEFSAEVWFEGEVVATRRVQARLGEVVTVELSAELPGARVEEEEELSAAPRHPLRGRVLSTRNRPARGEFRLTSRADFESESSALVWTKEQGRWSATFALEAPAGLHDVNLELEPAFRFDGPTQVELPHEGELLYTLRDDAALREVWLAPFDPETGAPIPAFEVELLGTTRAHTWLGGDEFHSATLPVTRELPSDVAFRWRCTATGRQAVGGFHEPDCASGPLRLAFPLPRGWGAFLYVGGPDAEPLEGAEILLDGLPGGRTDALGHLALAATERPARLEVRYRDWSLDSGDLEADGSFDDAHTGVNVYLAPPSRAR